MRQFHASKGVVVFPAWPLTLINFLRIFAICVELCTTFYFTHFVLSSPLKTAVSMVHFIAAITIRPSVFCTGRVTFCHLHIIFIEFRPVINAITYIVRQYHFTNTLGIPCISSVQATHNGRCYALSLRYKLPSSAKRMRSGARNPIHKLLRSNLGSYSETFIAYSKKETTKSHMYLRGTARPQEGARRENILYCILWYSLFVTRGFIYLNVCGNSLI